MTCFDVLSLSFWDGCVFGICYNHVTLGVSDILFLNTLFCLGGMSIEYCFFIDFNNKLFFDVLMSTK